MKAILFTGILCCLIAAVDAQTLLTMSMCGSNDNKKIVTDVGQMQQNSLADMDARFFAAE